jgi:hypothetical protein
MTILIKFVANSMVGLCLADTTARKKAVAAGKAQAVS